MQRQHLLLIAAAIGGILLCMASANLSPKTITNVINNRVEADTLDPPLRELVDRMNNIRTSQGLEPLSVNRTLCEAAQQRAPYYSHNAMGEDTGATLVRFGYRANMWAENIAAGQRSGNECAEAWWSSMGHRRNMLGDYTEVGVGMTNNLWCAIYARR